MMDSSRPEFEKYVFVCVNERPPMERVSCGGASCGKELAATLKKAVKEAGAADKIRVSKSMCLDVCEEGPNILVYPDNVWFKRVSLEDIPAILAKLGLKP
jgi:(2Fe-2S) ferredoxin